MSFLANCRACRWHRLMMRRFLSSGICRRTGAMRCWPAPRGFRSSACSAMQLEDIGTDFCRIGLTHRLELTNPMAACTAASSPPCSIPPSVSPWRRQCHGDDNEGGFVVGTVGLDVKFFKPLLAGRATAEARVQRKGRNIVFAEARLASDAGETLAVGTCIYLPVPLATPGSA